MTHRAKPVPNYLVERYRGWRAVKFMDSRAWYARLAREGQRPRAMVISCCDSRLDIVGMFGAEPGDLFVVRNVASLIPPYSPDGLHHGTSAAVEYAVTVLKVANILVIGHQNCGGVAACHDMFSGLAPELKDSGSFIGRWMDIMEPAYNRIADMEGDREERLVALEHEGVITSIENLLGFPFVSEAVEAGSLSVHGAWINIAEGRLDGLVSGERVFKPL